MQNPFEIDPFLRDLGEASDARREDRLRYGGARQETPPFDHVSFHLGQLLLQVIDARDCYSRFGRGEQWPYMVSVPEEVRVLWKKAADALGPVIAEAKGMLDSRNERQVRS